MMCMHTIRSDGACLKIVQSLAEHSALIVLGDASTSLVQCLKALPPALHPLAIEAQHPSFRAHKQIFLKEHRVEEFLLPAGCLDALRALATFTQLEWLSFHSSWYVPPGVPRENEL